MSFDNCLVEYCSPTLASIKTANMFSCSYENEEKLNASVEFWNRLFRDKGLELIILRKSCNTALIYLCRKNRLRADLEKPGVSEFLKTYGYESTDTEYALGRLKQRLKEPKDFPHEIGLFLSYPLDDVRGFIEKGPKNCICTGCWKVYCNECEAVKTFNKYRKCREVYSRLYRSGSRDIMQLAVRA